MKKIVYFIYRKNEKFDEVIGAALKQLKKQHRKLDFHTIVLKEGSNIETAKQSCEGISVDPKKTIIYADMRIKYEVFYNDTAIQELDQVMDRIIESKANYYGNTLDGLLPTIFASARKKGLKHVFIRTSNLVDHVQRMDDSEEYSWGHTPNSWDHPEKNVHFGEYLIDLLKKVNIKAELSYKPIEIKKGYLLSDRHGHQKIQHRLADDVNVIGFPLGELVASLWRLGLLDQQFAPRKEAVVDEFVGDVEYTIGYRFK